MPASTSMEITIMMNGLTRTALVGLALATVAGPANAAPQIDPENPHVGHVAATVEGPVPIEGHAHHHAASAPTAATLGPVDDRFKAILVASSPPNGAMLERSPPSISLTFPTFVTIHQIVLTNAVGQRLPVSTALPTEPVASFTSTLMRLDRGAYTIVWRGSNDRGETGGSLAFSIK